MLLFTHQNIAYGQQKNSDGTITLILGHNLQKGNPILELFLKRWASYFTQVTNNRGKIVFQGPQDGKRGKNRRFSNNNIDNLVRSGRIDLAFVNLFDAPKKSFFYSKLFALPFVARDTEIASHTFWDIATNYLREEYRDLELLSLHVDPYTMLHYGERPPIQLADVPLNRVLFPDDLKGHVIATNNTHLADFVKFSQGVSVNVPFYYQEKARTFTQGQTDAFWLAHSEINHEELSFLNRHTVFKGIGTPYYFAFNQDIFNLLPREWRKILKSSLGGKNLVDFAVEVTEHIQRTELSKLRNRNDLIVTLNSEQQHRWRNSANLYISDFFRSPRNINDEALVVIFNLMQENMIKLEKQNQRRR